MYNQIINGIEIPCENYLRVKNNHIIINPDFSSINKLYLNLVILDNTIVENQRIHLFISKYSKEINKCIIYILKHFAFSCKITIHIPKNVKDLKVVIEECLKEFKTTHGIEYLNCKVFIESKGPSFKIHNKFCGCFNDGLNDEVDIIYGKKGIHINYSLLDAEYSNYFYKGIRGCNKPGAIRTKPQKEYPELFKDLIIKQFKESTPEGILKSFKSDDDIWDYILGNGEWKVVGIDDGSKTKDNGGKK